MSEVVDEASKNKSGVKYRRPLNSSKSEHYTYSIGTDSVRLNN